MRIKEYEAKNIFKKAGIPIPNGLVASNVLEIVEAAKTIALPVVIKSQVLMGGRGKAGVIKVVETLEEVKKAGYEILNHNIKGYNIQEVLVEKKIDIKNELYCGIAINRTLGYPVIMISSEGGVHIEETFEKRPDKIYYFYCNPLSPVYSFQIIDLVKKLGLYGNTLLQVSQIVEKLFYIFKKYNCIIAEINPLVIAKDEHIWCVDAVMEIDDSSIFLYPELLQKKYERMDIRLKKMDERGATYVQLDGNIGLICSGAGLAMATMDAIKTIPGLSPANFLETGGGITAELMEDCMEVILEKNEPKGILINIYGGINPIHEGAKGIAKVIIRKKLEIPIVVKALGNKQEETWEILEKAGAYIYKSSDTMGAINYLTKLLGVSK